MGGIDIFPYEPRENQIKIMEDILSALSNKENFIFNAPAGSGKTACVLSSSLKFALENGRRIIYLTRTNSQQRQAIKELRAISRKIDFKAIAIQGKANMCLLIEQMPSMKEGSNEDISRLCNARKKKSIEHLRGIKHENRCTFFENFIMNREKLIFSGILSAEEMMEYGRKHGICAYEINKLNISDADVVVAPYTYIFDPSLREKFISWYGGRFDDTILIVDEAHNLPDFAREVMSVSLSIGTVKNAMKEYEEYNISDEIIFEVLVLLAELMEGMEEELKFSETDDMLIEGRIEREMKERGFGRDNLKKVAEGMMVYGDVVSDMKESQNMLPRSYLRSTGNFIDMWLDTDAKWVKIAEMGTRGTRIEAYCMEPSVATSVINNFYSSIHMSGTLEPVEEYVRSIGIEGKIARYGSPFPEENRKVVYVKGVTTKYYMGDEMLSRIAEMVVNTVNKAGKNTLIFFPSYSIMERFLSLHPEFNLKVFVERKNEKHVQLIKKIDSFRKHGGVFLSVMGGRLAEGVDFPSDELEMVIIFGIPYPPPSSKMFALQHYYDRKFGNGWKYVVEAKAVRRILQAVGRLIRSENDRGIAIIMDERAKRFTKYIEMEEVSSPAEVVMEFFQKIK